MRIESGYICLEDIRVYAYHGVFPQERVVGAEYLVRLRVKCDLSRAVESDEIADTLNYAEAYGIVRREMATPSRLLEHVAGRIGKAVLEELPLVEEVCVTVVKTNPPMGGDCQGAAVELHLINDKTHW